MISVLVTSEYIHVINAQGVIHSWSREGPRRTIFTWINELNSELLQDFSLTAHLVFYSLAPEFHSGVQQRPGALYDNKTLVIILSKDF